MHTHINSRTHIHTYTYFTLLHPSLVSFFSSNTPAEILDQSSPDFDQKLHAIGARDSGENSSHSHITFLQFGEDSGEMNSGIWGFKFLNL